MFRYPGCDGYVCSSYEWCPKWVMCPSTGHALSPLELPTDARSPDFEPLPSTHVWQTDCEYKVWFLNSLQLGKNMLGQLANIPTDTLIDMLYVILSGGVIPTANEVDEIEQIQRELQRRGEEERLTFGPIN